LMKYKKIEKYPEKVKFLEIQIFPGWTLVYQSYNIIWIKKKIMKHFIRWHSLDYKKKLKKSSTSTKYWLPSKRQVEVHGYGNTVVSNHFHFVKSFLFSFAKPCDFVGMLGTGLPVSMYTRKLQSISAVLTLLNF
jgi:hypothetical protein